MGDSDLRRESVTKLLAAHFSGVASGPIPFLDTNLVERDRLAGDQGWISNSQSSCKDPWRWFSAISAAAHRRLH